MTNDANPKPTTLPELRHGLTLSFNDYDADGKPQWLIHDPGRNKFFMIGLLEHSILERWDMKDPEKIIESVNTETTMHIENADIENFVHFLKRNYLIKQSGYDIHKQAKEQELFKDDNVIMWLIHNYLFFRIPLLHPDRFLDKTKWISNFIFSKRLAYLMSVFALIAIYQIGGQWDNFTHTFSSIFTMKGLFLYMFVFLFCKLCHELGHAYMCKRYDVSVPSFGIAFLVFWPVLYTDTTLSWSLSSDKRIRIAFAGIWVETYITIIAALLWCNTSNQIIQSITYLTITVNWIASLLINVSPFMRFDGYYILADYLKMPNLQPRAFALTRWQIRKWLFGWDDPAPEKFTQSRHNFLITYSLFTWIYRLVLYLGIAVLVYNFSIKIVGIILFLIEIIYFVCLPFYNEAKFWISERKKFTLNINTKITLTVTAILLTLFFLPIKQTLNLPATLSYEHQFLVAPYKSTLETPLPPAGTIVKANQTIATLVSPELDQAMRLLNLEYTKTLSELRRSAINLRYKNQKNVLLSDIKKQQAEYQKLLDARNKLNISVPFDGILIETAGDLRPGAIIMKDAWLGDVIKPNTLKIEAFASQLDFNSLQPGLTGYFYPVNLSLPSVPVTVTVIEALNAKELTCSYSAEVLKDKKQTVAVETPCYNASDLGGDIAANLSEEGKYVPTDSIYRVVLTTDNHVPIQYVERGTAIIKTQPHSYAYRFIYKIKRILLEESGF